jgi:Major Facilitator Superfamily
MADTLTTPARVTFGDVLAVGEYRALWAAQLVSIAGDQFARLALAVLVFGRTGSAGLAAVTFAVTVAAQFAGGLALGWVADRWPRRQVMITCDLVCVPLVAAMLIPGLPLWVLAGLLFAVSLALPPFLAARMALNRDILGPGRFRVGNGITMATYQVAQLAGFAFAGLVVAAAGPRPALAIDAASFAASALIIRVGVHARPRPDGYDHAGPERPEIRAGARLVFRSPVAATAMLLLWLAAFYGGGPEGVAVPLGAQLGGAAAAGWLLAALAGGSALGLVLYPRLITSARFTACAAGGACALLVLFAASPGLAGGCVILAAAGLLTGYGSAAGGTLFEVIPPDRRGQASGIVGAGMSLGQGVVILAAGAAAGRISPALVLAGCGLVGAVCAVPLAVRWHTLHR